MNTPLISIIVPVYNAGKYLEKCIESIINQTYKNIELILVNDGSTDNSKEICDKYAGFDNRVIVIHKANSGVSDTRNKGIDISKGEYIGFVDADDYIDEKMYEIMMSSIIDKSVDICACGYFIEDINDETKKITKALQESVIYNGEKEILSAYYRKDLYTGIADGNWNKLIKREAILDERYLNYTYAEDIEFQCRVFRRAKNLMCISDVLYHHTVNPEGASSTKYNDKTLQLIEVTDKQVEYVKDKYPELSEMVYAFRLTWLMVLFQVIIADKPINKNALNKVSEIIKAEYVHYKKNRYAKRLDMYYMNSLKMNVPKLAYDFRNFILKIKK